MSRCWKAAAMYFFAFSFQSKYVKLPHSFFAKKTACLDICDLSALHFICAFHEVLCQNWTQLKRWLEQSKARAARDGVTGTAWVAGTPVVFP